MVGARDLQRLQNISETMASTMPHARLVRLTGVAHLPHLEADPVTLTEIASFADQLDR